MAKETELDTTVKYEDSNKKIRLVGDGLEHEFDYSQENLNKAFQRLSGLNDKTSSQMLVTQAAESVVGNKDANTQFNKAIGLLEDIAPQDALEGMLAVQIVATHNMAMEMTKRALIPEQHSEVVTQCVVRATRLMNTFTSQVEALQKYRNKGQQVIKVQHVTVNDGGQAIVGDVKGGGD